jgi:hypothetical protein
MIKQRLRGEIVGRTTREQLKEKVSAELARGTVRLVQNVRLRADIGMGMEVTSRRDEAQGEWEEEVIGIEFPPDGIPVMSHSSRAGNGDTRDSWQHALVSGEESGRVIEALLIALENRPPR